MSQDVRMTIDITHGEQAEFIQTCSRVGKEPKEMLATFVRIVIATNKIKERENETK